MACTDDLLKIINPLSPFMDEGICDKEIKSKLQNMNNKDFDYLLSVLCEQFSITNVCPTYSIYKINLLNKNVSHHLDINDESSDNNDFPTIQYDDNHLFLEMLSTESFIFF